MYNYNDQAMGIVMSREYSTNGGEEDSMLDICRKATIKEMIKKTKTQMGGYY
jgi:hypothetical protein